MNEAPAVLDATLVAPAKVRRVGRALVWDSANTSALVLARELCRQGWTVDWIGGAASPWRTSTAFDGERTIAGADDEHLLRTFHEHPLDALFLCGDDHVRWILDHWASLPPGVRQHLSKPASLRTALSKEHSMRLALELGVPVLPTERCTSIDEATAAARRLAPHGEVVLKGEGGAAGCAVASVHSGKPPSLETWTRVTRFAPVAFVQRRIRGPRVFMSVVYEHGVERAACMHEKVATYPADFGPTAFGITRRVEIVHEYARRMFGALQWHGIANIEFRQDTENGRWYFIEINPRVAASMGIQEAAGIDIPGTWAAVCMGRGDDNPPGCGYREGVHYAWTVRGLALAFRRPRDVPAWGLATLLSKRSDLAALDTPLRWRALRLAFWLARQARVTRSKR